MQTTTTTTRSFVTRRRRARHKSIQTSPISSSHPSRLPTYPAPSLPAETRPKKPRRPPNTSLKRDLRLSRARCALAVACWNAQNLIARLLRSVSSGSTAYLAVLLIQRARIRSVGDGEAPCCVKGPATCKRRRITLVGTVDRPVCPVVCFGLV